jgi:hypothetical protein
MCVYVCCVCVYACCVCVCCVYVYVCCVCMCVVALADVETLWLRFHTALKCYLLIFMRNASKHDYSNTLLQIVNRNASSALTHRN